ncbi:MAG: HAD family phosphatase [Clostridia bacterium]|nr:HAD family phosphatase [Clostridia bacterium]
MNKVYGFDLDGTLVDSMSYFSKGILKVADDAGYQYDDTLIEILTPLGYTKSAEYYKTLGIPGTVEEIIKQIETNLYTEYANNIRTKPQVKEYLEHLKAGGAKLFVLTASPHMMTDVCLKNNGVYDLFDHVWSVEDFGMSKSSPDIFLHVAEVLGVTVEEITYYDDNLTAVTNSTKAGLDTVAVYDGQKPEMWEEIKATGKHYIDTFADAFQF